MCMCMCVREKEGERDTDLQRLEIVSPLDSHPLGVVDNLLEERESVVCVCVCKCVRERERYRPSTP